MTKKPQEIGKGAFLPLSVANRVPVGINKNIPIKVIFLVFIDLISNHLIHQGNPCPQGKARVQWLCQLNDPFATTNAELSLQLSKGVAYEPIQETITDAMALPISYRMGAKKSLQSSDKSGKARDGKLHPVLFGTTKG
jgi:hypothetical protein